MVCQYNISSQPSFVGWIFNQANLLIFLSHSNLNVRSDIFSHPPTTQQSLGTTHSTMYVTLHRGQQTISRAFPCPEDRIENRDHSWAAVEDEWRPKIDIMIKFKFPASHFNNQRTFLSSLLCDIFCCCCCCWCPRVSIGPRASNLMMMIIPKLPKSLPMNQLPSFLPLLLL